MVTTLTSTTDRPNLKMGRLNESLKKLTHDFKILKSNLMSIEFLGASGLLGQGIKTSGQENRIHLTGSKIKGLTDFFSPLFYWVGIA